MPLVFVMIVTNEFFVFSPQIAVFVDAPKRGIWNVLDAIMGIAPAEPLLSTWEVFFSDAEPASLRRL